MKALVDNYISGLESGSAFIYISQLMILAVASDSVSISIDGTSAGTKQTVPSTSHQVAHQYLHTPVIKPEDTFHNVSASKKAIGAMPTDLPPPPPHAINDQLQSPSNADLPSDGETLSNDGSEEYG